MSEKCVRSLGSIVLGTLFVFDNIAQPAISTQPVNQTASLFADATFRVTATGDVPFVYQWRFNDVPLQTETNVTLAIANVQSTNAGNYSVVVGNSSGSVTSRVATLTITPFNSIHEFGFSWTDTRGIGCQWTAPNFYRSRASNGPMWPEFFSTNLGLAYVASNNYAHCGDTAAQIGNQIESFSVPPKPELALYCIWLGADATLSGDRDVENIRRLYARGARQIMIESQFDILALNLHYFGTNASLPLAYRETLLRFNQSVMDRVYAFAETVPDLRIYYVDMHSHYYEVLNNPAAFGITETRNNALSDTTLADKSFTGPGADYVLWNYCHPTSKVHQLIAAWHLDALNNSVLEELDASLKNGAATVQMKRLFIGRAYLLQSSPDLIAWNDAKTFIAEAGTNQWTQAIGKEGADYFRLTWNQ